MRSAPELLLLNPLEGARGQGAVQTARVIQLQQEAGNRTVAGTLSKRPGGAAPSVQRDDQGEPYVEPSKEWDKINNGYASLMLKLAQANGRDPTVTRSDWEAEINNRWLTVGKPGAVDDISLSLHEVFLSTFEQNIRVETQKAQKKWQELQNEYPFEQTRLERFPDIKDKAREILDRRYQDTVRRVSVAGDMLVMEDLEPLNHMIGYDEHIHQAQDIKARQEQESQEAYSRKEAYEEKLYQLSDTELLGQISMIQDRLAKMDPASGEYASINAHLKQLELEMSRRDHKPYQGEEGAYPSDVARFSSFLIRGGYIEELGKLLPPEWAKYSEKELTEFLAQKYTEDELKGMFLEKYAERMEIKATFRRKNIISALVTGLIWSRDNIKNGEWGTAAAKIAVSGAGAYTFNKFLYARDKSAEELMATKAGEYGRWFKGAARSNKIVDFLARDLGKALLLWDLKNALSSGGPDGPHIPWDIIETIDINDPATWKEPDPDLLNLGFNLWYRQACTPEFPNACGMDFYLGKVEGSLIAGVMKAFGLLPHGVEDLKGRLFRIEGDYDKTDLFIFSVTWMQVPASANVLVLSTGNYGEGSISGTGHYSKTEVFPANEAAVELFGGPRPRYIDSRLLKPVETPDPAQKK